MGILELLAHNGIMPPLFCYIQKGIDQPVGHFCGLSLCPGGCRKRFAGSAEPSGDIVLGQLVQGIEEYLFRGTDFNKVS